jgi:hypothetical protein
VWRYRADNFFGCQISTRLNWDHIAIGNVNGLQMLEEQTTQWAKEKVQKDKKSTKGQTTIYKTYI